MSFISRIAPVLLGATILAAPPVQAQEQFFPLQSYRVGPYAAGGTGFFGGFIDYLTLINSSAYAFTAHTNTKIAAADLTKIGATGTYVLPYLCDGTDVLILGAWKKP